MKAIVGLAVVALASGCSLVRQHLTATAVGNHVYGQPLDELWPSAGRMLSDLGYSYTESTGAGGTKTQGGNAVAAAGPAMGGRNLRLEREFLARVDPEAAQEIAEDVDDALTHRAPVSGTLAHAP